MYFVYIIRCEDSSLYTGSSPNPKERFKKHKAGTGGKYTRSHRPVNLVYIEKLNTKSDAIKREMQIKRWRKDKKERLVKGAKL